MVAHWSTMHLQSWLRMVKNWFMINVIPWHPCPTYPYIFLGHTHHLILCQLPTSVPPMLLPSHLLPPARTRVRREWAWGAPCCQQASDIDGISRREVLPGFAQWKLGMLSDHAESPWMAMRLSRQIGHWISLKALHILTLWHADPLATSKSALTKGTKAEHWQPSHRVDQLPSTNEINNGWMTLEMASNMGSTMLGSTNRTYQILAMNFWAAIDLTG